MHAHPLAPTTHTLEMDQLATLNAMLRTRAPQAPITAADLELVAAAPRDGADGAEVGLGPGSVLERLSYDGPPDYPYVYAHFRSGAHGEAVVELHTAALRELARLLHQRELWGTGSSDSPAPSGINLVRLCCTGQS